MGKFQPGQSGNPGGRPKGSLAALWRRLNAEVDPQDAQGRTRAEVLYHKAYELATGGGRDAHQAIRLIADRVDGRPHQSVTLTTEQHDFVWAKVAEMQRAAEERGDPVPSNDECLLALSEVIPAAKDLLIA